MSTDWSRTYGLAHTASESSPVVRNDELTTREFFVPLLKLMPSANVFRMRMPENSRLLPGFQYAGVSE